jgi:hypothetical protein
MFTDIRILTLTFSYTPKIAGVLFPTDYLTTVTSLQGGHDYATVTTQANEPTSPYPNSYAKLNLAGHFIKGKHEQRIDTDSGLTVAIIPYYINILSPGCESVTEENAAEKYSLFRTRLAELSGLSEYDAWLTAYTEENFTVAHDAFIDFSDLAVEWWIDHDAAFPRINNAV